jgi:hypothetical protein
MVACTKSSYLAMGLYGSEFFKIYVDPTWDVLPVQMFQVLTKLHCTSFITCSLFKTPLIVSYQESHRQVSCQAHHTCAQPSILYNDCVSSVSYNHHLPDVRMRLSKYMRFSIFLMLQ